MVVGASGFMLLRLSVESGRGRLSFGGLLE